MIARVRRSASDLHRFRIAACAALLIVVAACGKGPTAPSDPTAGFSIAVENEPCVAPASQVVSCRFVVSPAAAAQDRNLRFRWRIENPANNRVAAGPGSLDFRTTFNCEFSSGVTTFDVAVLLTIDPEGDFEERVVTRIVRITRAPGACGT